jgi:DNA-binding CsgD family transcriptional regulator
VAITGFDWKAARSRIGAGLTADEKRIVELLAEGKSTPQIAKLVGTNRSAIWSKAKRIRQKLSNSTA